MTAVEQGRRLEQQVAAYFRTHGYATRCNVVLEGRSGGRHEVDVLAEKSDALVTNRIAVECKAWQAPIEKDVVAKLRHVLDDLGLNKGIVVSIGGCRSGAELAAAATGIDLWGPDELKRHLGDATVRELAVPVAANRTIAWGLAARVPRATAEQALRASGKGRLNLRTVEQLVWTSPLWLPVYCVQLTVAQPEVKMLRTRLRSTTVARLYDALGGDYLGPAPATGWVQVEPEDHLRLRETVGDAKVAARLTKAVEAYRKVSTQAAVERHTAALHALGIPTPCASLAVGESATVYLPFYAGVLQAGRAERIAAVDGWRGQPSPAVSQLLTTHLAQVRAHFAPR